MNEGLQDRVRSTWVRSRVRALLLVVALIFLTLILLGTSQVSVAQSGEDTASVTSQKETFRAALSAYRSGNYVESAQNLGRIVQENPSLRLSDESGSVGYWLGRVYEAQARPDVARHVWLATLKHGVQNGQFDIRAADAYIRSVFRDSVKAKYKSAANAYLLLLEAADQPFLREVQEQVIRRHLAQMVFLLPDEVRSDAIDGAEERTVDRSQTGGHTLASWWRAQDTQPATSSNERLIEHLQRVEHATSEYGYARARAGFDGRGRIYVRLGEPTLVRSVDFHSRDLLDVLQRIDKSTGNNLSVNLSTFADNEFWLYERGEEPYPYLFVDDGNSFQVGGVMDLVPSRLTTAMHGRTGRGGAKADVVLEAMRTAYRQLSTYHMGFGPGFNRLDGYLNAVEGARIRARSRAGGSAYTRTNRSDNAAVIQKDGATIGISETPTEKARSAVSHAKREALQMDRKREENVPRQETETLDDVASLPVDIRVARFLEEDGTTSTRVYWGLSRQALEDTPQGLLTSGPRLIQLSVRYMNPDYRVGEFEAKEYLVNAFEGEEPLVVADEQVEIGGDTSTYHLGLQWDQYTVESRNDTTLTAQDRIRTGVVKLDSLSALSADEGQLEMSDLVPAVHPSETAMPKLGRELEHPYPFEQISEETPLAFYFELYHLQKGEDGKSRYSVEYELHRTTKRGRLERLVRGTKEQKTAVATSREGRDRMAKEYIVLDLDGWEGTSETELTVTVRVTDEQSGQAVERTVDFHVVPPGER